MQILRQSWLKSKPMEAYCNRGETADVNPGYRNDNSKQSPFYAAYGLLVSGEDANTYYRANAYSIDYLEGNDDPRLGYFFKRLKARAVHHILTLVRFMAVPQVLAYGGDQTSNIGEGLVRNAEQVAMDRYFNGKVCFCRLKRSLRDGI